MCLDSCFWIICEISIGLVIVHSLDTRSTFVSKNMVVYTEQELWTIFRQQGKASSNQSSVVISETPGNKETTTLEQRGENPQEYTCCST